jgi:hypothetical protein
MPVSLESSVAAVVAGLSLVVLTLGLVRVTGKPRFLIALCLVALAMAGAESVEMLGPADDYRHVWFGLELAGTKAMVAGLVDVSIYIVGAAGLWTRRRWARIAAMIYLLYLLVSFVIWGVRGADGQDVLSVMAWQMLALPFITFSLMYLQNASAYFGVTDSERERKTGWLY